jgi:3-ketoacyl-CoA synthase
MFDCVARVLAQTNTKAKDIDILVVNCSLFSPTPSLCSMIINHFNMRADVCSYNLSGMGCSAGVISIELVKNMLAAKPNSTALIMSTENLTQNLYLGNDRGFLLQNTLFRVGGAAMILSNKWTDAFRARFKLLHVVRTQYVSEESVGCVYETQDANKERGVRLSKDIVKVAGRYALRCSFFLSSCVSPLVSMYATVIWLCFCTRLSL